MTEASQQRVTVAILVTEVERICAAGLLPAERELALRAAATNTAIAFDMAPVQEREGVSHAAA